MENELMNWRPPHAYVPGISPRHPEGYFDNFKTGIDSLTPEKFYESMAWKLGILFLKDGYFWEAHELLESVWMSCPPNSAEKCFVQAVIQKANSGLKRKMGLDKAAAKLDAESNRLAKEAFLRSQNGIFGFSEQEWWKFAGNLSDNMV